MTKKEMKLSLKKAVMDASPDVLDQILSPSPQRMASVMEFKEERKTVYYPQKRLRAAACALSLFLVLCVSAVFYSVPKVESVVSIDVNPSVELSVDQRNCVVGVKAVNEDSKEVLDGLELSRKNLGAATDEIFQSMIWHGYLSPEKEDNTILISVANQDTKRAEEIQQVVTQSVTEVLKTNNTQARLIQQQDVKPTEELRQFAEKHNISVGKADYVMKITQTDSSLNPEELSVMSIAQLSTIAEENDLPIESVETPTPPKDSGSKDSGSKPEDEVSSEPEEESSASAVSSEASVSQPTEESHSSGNSLWGSNSSEEESEEEPEYVPIDRTGQYCEYCGRFLVDCQGSCDKSEGKKFCPDCGRYLSYCVCGDKQEVESSSIDDEESSEISDELSEQENEERMDSPDDSIQILYSEERYCEYCGQLRTECRDRCDRSGPPLYCSRCGRLKINCMCRDSGKPEWQPYPINP